MASGLAQRGHEVTVATFDAPGAPTHYRLDKRVDYVALGLGDPRRSSRPAEAVQRVIHLRRLVKARHPDITVGFMHSSYALTAIALLGLRAPFVASEHTSADHFSTRPAIEGFLMRVGQGRASVVTIPSESAKRSFGPRLARRMVVIKNPVAPPALSPSRVRKPVVLAVGRLEQPKDPLVLVEAFAQIAARHSEWRLCFLGDGPLRSAVADAVRKHGLSDRVDTPGFSTDVPSVMRSASILAVPSRYESFGLATAEGLLHGLPAVGFADCPGTNELIVDGINGVLVNGPDRMAALADGLERLISDASLRERLGAAAPSTVRGHEPALVVDAWESQLHASVPVGRRR